MTVNCNVLLKIYLNRYPFTSVALYPFMEQQLKVKRLSQIHLPQMPKTSIMIEYKVVKDALSQCGPQQAMDFDCHHHCEPLQKCEAELFLSPVTIVSFHRGQYGKHQ